MIVKKVLEVVANFRHPVREKEPPSSNGEIFFTRQQDPKQIHSMPVAGSGHQAFQNGFGRKRK
jgi:hypothetical protein